MKKKIKIFILISFGILLLLHVRVIYNAGKQILSPVPKREAEISAPTGATPTPQKDPEAERRLQEEETRRFIAQFGPCRNVPILIYHHVGDKNGGLWVKTESFREHISYLTQKDYTTITLVDLMENLQNGKSLPAKPVVITFDDGYRDFYEKVYPILKEFNFKATIFVVTQLLGGSEYLTWDQLAEMQGSGLVTIGNHTLSHSALTALDEAKLKDEIVSANDILKEKLGRDVNVFAYPYGSLNGEAEKVLKDGGFKAAVTTNKGVSCAKLP
ncbi:MAG: polysaccharide deacetylase family protein, partial [bacterium]|nr:polysaccharide deacetylase family protein [bacterium]